MSETKKLRINFFIFLFFLTAVSTAGFYFIFQNSPANANDSLTVTVRISVCGNDEAEGGEDCDGTDLAGASCVNRGYASGALSCDISCDYDVSQCVTPSCGDGSCNSSETCSSCPSDCGACASSSSGGGGGGGYIVPVVTRATFKGKAYPNSNITLLKDAQVAATTKAGSDANFEISLSGLSGGTYNFGIWAEDSKGNRSITHTFPISVTSGSATVISGIFLPPTINIDKTEVKRGDVLNILGYSSSAAEISLFVNSNEEIIKKFSAGTDGAWLFKFDTLEAEYGDHTTRARASKGGDISVFSQAVAFKIGEKNVFSQPQPSIKKADLNGDSKVNLVDFSIAAYWYKRANPPASVDLNNDKKVDLVDFSIMAYYWTG